MTKKLSLLFTLMLSTLMASAYDAKVDGIYYNLIKKARLAWVVSGDVKYSGNVYIPENFIYEGQTYNVTSISSRAFYGCTNLTSVNIPNSVKSIENEAFTGCSNLTTVFIGSGIETIENSFENCLELTNVYCFAKNVPTTNSNAFKGSYVEYATLYVPTASMATYQTIEPWSNFGNLKNISNLPVNETVFPDANFRNWILSQEFGRDGILTEDEIANVTSISVSRRNIKTLQGIKYFTALSELNCNGNELTSLDVSKNTALTSLICYDNQLSSLDVSGCVLLRYLHCYINRLTSLDVLNNTALTMLSCHSNQLTSLNVSKNVALTELICFSNQIKGTAMDEFVANLPTENKGVLYIIYNKDEGNVMTTTQVTDAKAKGWSSRIYDGSKWVEYAGSKPENEGVVINALNFPDDKFRNYLLSQSFGSDGVLTDTEIAKVTGIYVSGQNIKNLQGLEFFTALTHLDCDFNQLSSLDVSKNVALKNLLCGNNQLSSLDVSKNTAITYIACNDNNITSLDVSKIVALRELYCYNNQINSLNISGCTLLNYLSCFGNQLSSLDVSKNTMLTGLYCYDNQLTSLDVSGCTTLKELDCYKNQIKGRAMDKLVASLPTKNDGALYIIYNKDEGNIMTTKQVTAAKAKGWKPYYTKGDLDDYGYPIWIEYDGSEPENLRGDANGDGEVDMDDATFVTNIILGIETATEAADVNNDGVVNMPDVMFIINYIKNGMFPDEE